MNIQEYEKKEAKALISKLLKHQKELPYANIGNYNEYLGWVSNFNLTDADGRNINLDLKKENDLFLLFVLAIAWSRSGPWENAAYLVSYLKIYQKDAVDFWLDQGNCSREEAQRKKSATDILNKTICHTESRRQIAFRSDIYKSINILATNWQEILNKLDLSEKHQDFRIFMEFMRSIEGLGVKNRKIMIKIPLILRELRCQKVYSNIPGELCCVPDTRVIKAGKSLGISLSMPSDLDRLIAVSTKIYKLFGDLYDLPLFAYEDLKKKD